MNAKTLLLLLLLLLVGLTFVTAQERCLGLTPSPDLQKYVDPVPVLRRIRLRNTSKSKPVTIGAYKIRQKLHRDLPETTLYAFGASINDASLPGPTLVALEDEEAYVRWTNNLTDANHTLPVDPIIRRAEPKFGIPLVVHLHGGVTEPPYDGHPDAWFTNGGERGANFTTNLFKYTNAQPPTLLWYHDHSFGYTRLSVAAGLAGLYLIVSPNRDPVWLPAAVRERSSGVQNPFIHDLVVQDRQFFSNGSIKYPVVGVDPSAHPNWCPDYFGDTVLVNGKVWPYLNVSRGVHRFRFLNGGNSRFFTFNLSNPTLKFVKIGTDGGYLSTPVEQSELTLAPAERADVLIDFSSLSPGENVSVTNTAPAPFVVSAPDNQSVMLFRVTDMSSSRVRLPKSSLGTNQTIRGTILRTTGLDVSNVNVNRTRQFVIGAGLSQQGGLMTLFSDGTRTFRDPPTELVKVYTDEVWEFVNTIAGVSHPMHIHLVNFIVLNQQMYNNSRFTSQDCALNVSYPDPRSCFTEPPRAPDLDHLGWKDTATVKPFAVTRFLVPFSPRDRKRFPFDPTESPGYVWHCHLLEHEDNEMMRPLLLQK